MDRRRTSWRRRIVGCVLLGLTACGAPGAGAGAGAASDPDAPRIPILLAAPGHGPLALPDADPEAGRLLIFVQPGASALAHEFQQRELPQILALAEGMGIAASVIDVTRAAPPSITLTPQIVYQNHRGRSVYEGRYATPDRLRNFLRTARRAPLGEAGHEARDVLVWRHGRTAVTAPLKIGEVTGTPPDGYDHAAFEREARHAIDEALADGSDGFHREAAVSLGRGDRAFYMDFYPYRDRSGTLYVSTALFSQFHCKQPVYRTPADAPFSGDWSDRESVFARAARALEQVLVEQLADTSRGDGFDAVPTATPEIAWFALGLDLPARPASAPADTPRGALPHAWRLSTDAADATDGAAEPALLFHLAAPLDSYRGEVEELSGDLDLSVHAAHGEVVVTCSSVSMGDPDLDKWIHGPAVLDAEQFPEARFALESLVLDSPVAWGHLTPATGTGTFTMRGETVPMSVRAELEPYIAADGRVQLHATGSFGLSLGAPWSVDVPLGSAPGNQQLVFDFAFRLEPAGS